MKKSKLLNKFNIRARQWLTDLQNYSDAQIAASPTPDSWSLAELYDHIMRVARTYQMPNFHKSMGPDAKLKKKKNLVGLAVFNFGIRKQVKIRMEDFPAVLVENFTPQKRSKEDLIADFEEFIQEVNELHDPLTGSKSAQRHYHPMFGNISTKEWFSLIEIHMSHHEVQRKRIEENARRIHS